MPLLTIAAAAIFLLMTALWLLSLARRDASIVDAFWGAGFVGLAWLYCLAAPSATPRGLVLASLVTLWGGRLTWHIATRNRGQPEDLRYQAMRRRWGRKFWWVSLMSVFWLQGALMWLIALPLYAATRPEQPPFGMADAAGLALFAAGLAFEAVADAQLRRFRAQAGQRGKTLQTGLWRYSRHPNYFGDALLWWGLFFTAAVASGAYWAVVSPVTMTVLLTRVSGVPLLEAHLRRTRPDYAAYAAKTSAFFPLPPREATPVGCGAAAGDPRGRADHDDLTPRTERGQY